MQHAKPIKDVYIHEGTRSPNLGDLLTARPSGLTEPESWAILCQAVQALQDLFLSDHASSNVCLPLVTPNSLALSARGRVKLCQNGAFGSLPPAHLTGYLAPEYRPNKQCSDNEMEKMWIYALGETMKRTTLTSHAATSRLSAELCRVLADMTRLQSSSRASLMHLLDVISEYCKKRQQNRPFSHIVMDLHQEAMAAIEMTLDTPWGPPAMPELRPRTGNRCESSSESVNTIPRRWIGITRANNISKRKLTKEASTSMENLHQSPMNLNTPGTITRPKSMCVPDTRFFTEIDENYYMEIPATKKYNDLNPVISDTDYVVGKFGNNVCACKPPCFDKCVNGRTKIRRNPVQRAASRLYRATSENKSAGIPSRDCVGPEFVVRASLPVKQLVMPDCKGNVRKTVTVIMLNGQKLDVLCNPNTTTAGQLFEIIIQKEHIEENFMLGLSALIAGDFVFLPSDTRICKAMQTGNLLGPLTLFMRVRFFLPSLRGVRSAPARHLLYLQLRRSILEHQLPCSFNQLIELDGFALQAEFGDFNEKEHGTRDYFLLDHYVPETMTCAVDSPKLLRQELIKAHKFKKGLDGDKAEQDFITIAQSLSHYGGHFYTATWMLKDNNHKDVWLYISAQGINLYERTPSASHCGPQLYEMFEWRSIQTLCYSKQYLCILPHSTKLHASKLKKYKLRMDNKKSYFTFRLASLHHQFFLRLRTEYTSLQSLSQQFGIPLKDIKNETNSLAKLEALAQQTSPALDNGAINAETEFKIEFRSSSKCTNNEQQESKCKRSKSVNDFFNENIEVEKNLNSGLVLNSSCFSGLPIIACDKRRGVKMGTRAISSIGHRMSRSMEAVNSLSQDYLEEMSLQSVSLNCSSNSIPPGSFGANHHSNTDNAYILDASIKSCTNQLLPDFQETLSESLVEKLNNFSFAEERALSTIIVERDSSGSLGMQITEGSDGNVYVQSVITGGPAHTSGNILRGDQIVAVDHRSLLGMRYGEALNVLKATGHRVEFIVSRTTPFIRKNIHSQSTLRISDVENLKGRINLSVIDESNVHNLRLENTINKLKRLSNTSSYPSSPSRQFSSPRQFILGDSPVEKHNTESCFDLSNTQKYGQKNANSPLEVPYHKHIRYEIETKTLNKNISKSCTQIYHHDSDRLDNDRAVIVEMILKGGNAKFQSLDRKLLRNLKTEPIDKNTIPPIALPRSLGLSRKWRGPVRYPVTPIKKSTVIIGEKEVNGCSFSTTSDDEQVFI